MTVPDWHRTGQAVAAEVEGVVRGEWSAWVGAHKGDLEALGPEAARAVLALAGLDVLSARGCDAASSPREIAAHEELLAERERVLADWAQITVKEEERAARLYEAAQEKATAVAVQIGTIGLRALIGALVKV